MTDPTTTDKGHFLEVHTMNQAAQLAAISVDEARALTDKIKETAFDLCDLLLEAHEREAWRPLGYSSWREYATSEFSLSQSRIYQLLDQGRVVKALTEAAGVSTNVEINESEARRLKPVLPAVTEEVKESVRRGEQPETVIAQIVERRQKSSRREATGASPTKTITPEGGVPASKSSPEPQEAKSGMSLRKLQGIAKFNAERLGHLLDRFSKDDSGLQSSNTCFRCRKTIRVNEAEAIISGEPLERRCRPHQLFYVSFSPETHDDEQDPIRYIDQVTGTIAGLVDEGISPALAGETLSRLHDHDVVEDVKSGTRYAIKYLNKFLASLK